MAKILLVEDSPDVKASVHDWLKAERYLVEVAETGADALQLLENFEYDVIILDWGLPDITGQEVLRKFRAAGGQTPVIFLTGRSDMNSKLTGLDSGADDYLTKPVELPELSARVRSRLRRPGGFQPFQVTLGNVYLDADKHFVSVDGSSVHLTTKEFAVLEFLMRHPKEVFGSRALRDKLWPSDADILEDTVRVCVKSLRRKITSNDVCIVKTILGSGYTVDAD